jgi:hypothetical protein
MMASKKGGEKLSNTRKAPSTDFKDKLSKLDVKWNQALIERYANRKNYKCWFHPNANHSSQDCYTQHPAKRPEKSNFKKRGGDNKSPKAKKIKGKFESAKVYSR